MITQQTFDDVVRENMTEFEMSAEEAVNDAKEQFQSQVRKGHRSNKVTGQTRSQVRQGHRSDKVTHKVTVQFFTSLMILQISNR